MSVITLNSQLYKDGTDRTAIQIGAGSTSVNNTIAIGSEAKSEYENGISLGTKAISSYNGIAIGSGAKNKKEINNNLTIIGENAIAIGVNSEAPGESAISIGAGSKSEDMSVAIGNEASVAGGSIAIGYQAQVTGLNSIAIGLQALADEHDIVTIGNEYNRTFYFGPLRVDVYKNNTVDFSANGKSFTMKLT
jgi:hypothetical protein